jgi:hypothetical protein
MMQMALGMAVTGYATALPSATDVSMYVCCLLPQPACRRSSLPSTHILNECPRCLYFLANVGRPKEHYDKS